MYFLRTDKIHVYILTNCEVKYMRATDSHSVKKKLRSVMTTVWPLNM